MSLPTSTDGAANTMTSKAGTVAHMWTCYPTLESQMWDRNDSGQLVNRASGLCLTIPGDTTQEGTQAVIA